jgi:stage III sporulation protein SpoIIIAA/intein/homing endonuclease
MSEQRDITSNIDVLLETLPLHIQQALETGPDDKEDLLEIIMDLGRLPEARYRGHERFLSDREVAQDDIDYVINRIATFGEDNRAGIPRTLHRISAIRNRAGKVIGLTCRVGRAVFGTIAIVRDLVESGQSVLLLGRPGVGKCVTGDSLILTDNGLQPIANLIPDALDEDQFVPIQCAVFGRNGLEPASHAYNGGLSETLRVTTRQGFALEGTPEHPILALDKQGELVFRRLDELKISDYLAIQRGQQSFGIATQLPSFEFAPRINALDSKLPSELTEELGRFLGYLVAEGTLSFDNQVSFCYTDPEIQADMTYLTESLFGLRLRQHVYHGEWNGKDFRIFGVKFRRYLAHLGLTLGLAADKRIPPCILTAPKSIVTAFLQALFEGDGSAHSNPGRVEIASASRMLLSQLHILLLNYGIVANLRAKRNTKYDRDYYYLTLIGENVARFAQEIGFLSTTKRAKLESLVAAKAETPRNPNLDVIPHLNDRLRGLRGHINTHAVTLSRFTRSDNRAPSYRSLRRILAEAQEAVADPLYQELNEVLEANFFFDPVKRIEEGEAYVYDLSVPGSHSFFANGFVSHNTTMLRETARVEAEDLRKRVVIVDTSNEIAGDGDIPHPGIGRARRMQVPRPSEQHAVMIEAVENHMPEVIVIDEIGTELEALAARTIAERGVQLIGTAHGNTLDNLMVNPTLSDLIGGIQAVTLGDEEARRRGTQKTVLERKAPPTFDVLVEIQSWDRVIVYSDVASAVDSLLRGEEPRAELRQRDADGQISVESVSRYADDGAVESGSYNMRRPNGQRDRGTANGQRDRGAPSRQRDFRAAPAAPAGGMSAPPQRIYPFGVGRDRLERAIANLHVPATIVRDMNDATMVMTLKNYYRQGSHRMREAEERGVPIYVLRGNTITQMERQLADIFRIGASEGETRAARAGRAGQDEEYEARLETEQAITQVLNGERQTVELTPRSNFIRRLQHQIAEHYNVRSESQGREPNRRVKIFR